MWALAGPRGRGGTVSRWSFVHGGVVAAAFIGSFPLCAEANDDIMANYFGNTVVVSAGHGESHVHYRPDHTFDSKATTWLGDFEFKGTWQIDDKGNLCRVIDPKSLPFPVPGSSKAACFLWKAHNIGETWTVDVNGQSAQFSLQAGLK